MRRHIACVSAFLLCLGLALPLAAAESRPDAWITTKVKMALLTSDRVDGLDVNVDTVDGRVTLHGTVASAEQKARAEQLAGEVVGVREVRNLLQVGEGEEPEAAGVADDQLRERVETVLQRDQALEDSQVEVKSVNDGVVLLTGDAATLSDHRRALEDARNVDGVRHVASEIQSPDELGDEEIWREGKVDATGAARSSASDIWITTKAKVALLTDERTPGLDISVDTRDGVVTLFGKVPSEEAKQAAEAEVKGLGGVRAVENELQVVADARQQEVERSDERIREDVESRLAERSDLEGASIDVAVVDGVARLTGTVPQQADRITALTLVGDTQGVSRVVDDLRVEGTPAVSAEPPRGTPAEPEREEID